MRLTRRHLMASLPAFALISGCQERTSASTPLQALVDAPRGQRAPAAGYVIARGGTILAADTVGFARFEDDSPMPFSASNPFRAASISKLVTALTAAALHDEGVVDLDAPIGVYWPDLPSSLTDQTASQPSLRALLSHTSGLADPPQYWLAHPGELTDWLAEQSNLSPHQPGYFAYCNLGYGLVATVLEKATGQRFDHLTRKYVLDPLAMDAGFNWSDVSADKRSIAATLYRETAKGWETQIDRQDQISTNMPSILLDTGADLDTYKPGQNGTLFSPQGGLRANLTDLAMLAYALRGAPELAAPVWRLNGTQSNGLHDAEYFTQFGTGVHVYAPEDSFWPGQTLWGHHGEAYGLYAGAWYVPDLDISFSYAVTGTPETPPARSQQHPALNTFTEVLVAAIRTAYATMPATK